MITVSILINGRPIFTRTALRTTTGSPNTYTLDDGSKIEHEGSNGAVALAKMMLDTIKEPKHEPKTDRRWPY